VRGIFVARAHDARFLRRLRAFFCASTDLLRAHSKITSSEIVGPALFSTLRLRRSYVRESVVTPDLYALDDFAARVTSSFLASAPATARMFPGDPFWRG
jgi:hypothetical protein